MAATADIPPGLEIDQDIGFLRRLWRVQRVGWLCMSALVAAGLSGALGAGPLARTRIDVAGVGASISWDRVMRQSARATLEVALPERVNKNLPRTIFVDAATLRAFRIESIVPSPTHTRAAADGVIFDFDVAARGVVRFHVVPEDSGMHRAILRLDDGDAVPLRCLVLP